jgi:membrane protein
MDAPLKVMTSPFRKGWGRLADAAEIAWYALRRFDADNGYQAASALTYTALLAVVPLLTVTFGLFSAFPAFDRVQAAAQGLIVRSLVPTLGDVVLSYLNDFVTNARALTGFGVIFLAVTVLLLFNTIEGAFNAIWRAAEPRPVVMRLLSFWAVLTMTPLILAASLSAASGLLPDGSSVELVGGDGALGWALGRAVPAALELVAFLLLYISIPNRSVRWQDAAIGSLVVTVLLETAKYGFGAYIGEFPTNQAIYGALAVVPIFLLWLYLLWSIVLFGAELAAGLPEWRAGRITRSGPEGLLTGQRLVVALAILGELRQASKLGVGLRRSTLVQRVPVGAVIIDGMLERLRNAHWVVRSAKGAWIASRDLREATLYDLQKSLGSGLRGNLRAIGQLTLPWQDRLADLVERAEAADREIMGIALADLLDGAAGTDQRSGSCDSAAQSRGS